MRGILIKFVLAIVLFILTIGFVFFRKDEYKTKPLDEQPLIQQEEVQDEKIIKELTEEDRIKTIAETFTSIYYTYSWGNFFNIESLYDYMTDEMASREKDKVEKMKEEIENQPLIYFGVSSFPQNINIIYLDQNRAKIEIEIEQYKVEGASIYIEGILTRVDKFGNKLLVYPNNKRIANKKIIMELKKGNNKWKVDKIDIN